MGQDSMGGAGALGPQDPSGYAGMNQGAQGASQGFHGSVRGQAVGPMEGMRRMAPQTAGGQMDPRLLMILKALAAAIGGRGDPPPGAGGPPPQMPMSPPAAGGMPPR